MSQGVFRVERRGVVVCGKKIKEVMGGDKRQPPSCALPAHRRDSGWRKDPCLRRHDEASSVQGVLVPVNSNLEKQALVSSPSHLAFRSELRFIKIRCTVDKGRDA
ncbi:uncharacterized protein VTP21DRAFT_7362 [Calcarisporiella thermophila]|uniref:uncharacterized protein n=1 Tax=Calcarisporiella thermophila TaxID=911321 RepID=UPI003743A6BE